MQGDYFTVLGGRGEASELPCLFLCVNFGSLICAFCKPRAVGKLESGSLITYITLNEFSNLYFLASIIRQLEDILK